MPLRRKLILFILVVAGAFVYLGNAIPQIKSEPVEEVSIGQSPADLIAAGKKIFTSDRAQCLTCHSLGEDPKARCPNQDGLGDRAKTRKPGLGVAEYLVESVYNPNAFVVPGYPANQMTPVNKPPIALSHDEILAAITFLNSLGGTTDEGFIDRVKKAQDPWRKGLLKPEQPKEEAKLPLLAGDVSRGREVFKVQCLSCHRVGNEGRDVCPDLTAIGSSQTPDYIMQSILDPNAVIVKGYKNSRVELKGGTTLMGVASEWMPNRDRPERLRLNVVSGTQAEERIVEASDIVSVGPDTVLMYDSEEDDTVAFVGEVVSGDKPSGVMLRMLVEGRWVERRFGPENLQRINTTLSPMPGNLAEILTPREFYDVAAYLMAQKGAK